MSDVLTIEMIKKAKEKLEKYCDPPQIIESTKLISSGEVGLFRGFRLTEHPRGSDYSIKRIKLKKEKARAERKRKNKLRRK